MRVGDYVRLAIDAADRGEDELALLLACVAVDGTAAKRYITLGNRERFCRFLRDSAGILGPMAVPGIDLLEQQFPVALDDPKVTSRDLAFVVYKFYRCTVAHGDEFDEGFGLIEDVRSNPNGTSFRFANGSLMLSNRLIWGLLASAVFAQENVGEAVPEGYHFTYGGRVTMIINDMWGSGSRFETSIAPLAYAPRLNLDFGDWIP